MHGITYDDVRPHLRQCLFITGSFVVAWSWDLVCFGASHVWQGQSPLDEQIGFGSDYKKQYSQSSTLSLLAVIGNLWPLLLLLEYLIVCGLASTLSVYVKDSYNDRSWCPAAIMAVEFFPAPFFSGKLMAYLGTLSGLDALHQLLVNFMATALAAFLAHVVVVETRWWKWLDQFSSLQRFAPILAETMAFGLGVAWNTLMSSVLAPDEMDTAHILGLVGYLILVFLIAFRLAALHASYNDDGDNDNDGSTDNNQQPSLQKRMVDLSCFAFNVVCAFTLVATIRALLAPGWVGDVLSLVVLVFLTAIMSSIVASVEVGPTRRERSRRQRRRQRQQERDLESADPPKIGFGTCAIMDALVFVPCVWCCCPWVPLAWLLAGVTPDIHVQQEWQKLIAFCAGLAASIQASGMLTTLTDTLSVLLGICGPKHCSLPWFFVVLQVFLAIVTTAALLPPLGWISDNRHQERAQTRQTGERQSLLSRAKKLLPRFSQESK